MGRRGQSGKGAGPTASLMPGRVCLGGPREAAGWAAAGEEQRRQDLPAGPAPRQQPRRDTDFCSGKESTVVLFVSLKNKSGNYGGFVYPPFPSLPYPHCRGLREPAVALTTLPGTGWRPPCKREMRGTTRGPLAPGLRVPRLHSDLGPLLRRGAKGQGRAGRMRGRARDMSGTGRGDAVSPRRPSGSAKPVSIPPRGGPSRS